MFCKALMSSNIQLTTPAPPEDCASKNTFLTGKMVPIPRIRVPGHPWMQNPVESLGITPEVAIDNRLLVIDGEPDSQYIIGVDYTEKSHIYTKNGHPIVIEDNLKQYAKIHDLIYTQSGEQYSANLESIYGPIPVELLQKLYSVGEEKIRLYFCLGF